MIKITIFEVVALGGTWPISGHNWGWPKYHLLGSGDPAEDYKEYSIFIVRGHAGAVRLCIDSERVINACKTNQWAHNRNVADGKNNMHNLVGFFTLKCVTQQRSLELKHRCSWHSQSQPNSRGKASLSTLKESWKFIWWFLNHVTNVSSSLNKYTLYMYRVLFQLWLDESAL